MRISRLISKMGDHGTMDIGGSSSHTFAEDGEALYSDRHPTWASALFAQMVRPWETC